MIYNVENANIIINNHHNNKLTHENTHTHTQNPILKFIHKKINNINITLFMSLLSILLYYNKKKVYEEKKFF